MKYFSPNYWFKLWKLSAPLSNDKTQVIKTMSVDNKQNIKDWASESTFSLDYWQLNFTNNNQTNFINYQTHLDAQTWEKNLTQETSTTPHKHHHEKSRNRVKKEIVTMSTSITANPTKIPFDDVISGLTSTVIKINKSISSSGIKLNNDIYFNLLYGNLYFGAYGKVCKYDPITGQQKIVITAKDIIPPGIILNGKLYFGSKNGKIYEYDAITGQQKTIIITNGKISLANSFNNKLYFGSTDGNVYQYDPITEQQKIVITTKDIIPPGIILNGKIYFSSWEGKVYEYDPITGQQKIVITTNNDEVIIPQGSILNGKLYFSSTNGKVYEYDPITEQQKNVITTKYIIPPGIILNGKLYFGSTNGKVYEYDAITGQQKIVITTNNDEVIIPPGVTLNGKLYFSATNDKIYEYDPITKQQKIIIITNGNMISSVIVLNNKLYFGSWDDKIHEYDPITKQQKIIITAEDIISQGIILNGKLYFSSKNGKVYKYEPLELSDSKIISINEQVKKGLHLHYNHNWKIKNIQNITLDNLKVTNVFFVKNKAHSPLIPLIKNKLIKNPCRNISGYLVNKSEEKQRLSTAACDISLTTTHSIQKLNGFTATTSNASTFSWDWNLKVNIGAKASGEISIPFIATGKVETSLNIEPSGGETRSSTSTTANANTETKTKIETKTETVKITYPSQRITLLPHSKVQVSVLASKRELEFNLTFSQKVEGEVSAIIIDENNIIRNVTVSIKNIMLELQKHNILPLKISLNEDDSINFIYNTKIIEQEIISKVIVGKMIPLTSKGFENKKKKDVFDIRKRHEKKHNNKNTSDNELKNANNWYANISKVINQEEHLISNNTNYVANNVATV